MNPWKLKTINDALEYCQEAVRRYDVEMKPKEKEDLASELLGFSSGDYFSEWRKNYPVVDEIQALSADLSWSNAIDIDDDWEKLINYIEELERQVKSAVQN
jgi:hypothetical protein